MHSNSDVGHWSEERVLENHKNSHWIITVSKKTKVSENDILRERDLNAIRLLFEYLMIIRLESFVFILKRKKGKSRVGKLGYHGHYVKRYAKFDKNKLFCSQIPCAYFPVLFLKFLVTYFSFVNTWNIYYLSILPQLFKSN